ncbi:hypothetical protein T11_9848 [Trichinella zimbabwensis]|uniref:Uncharacterized protein n=1 Tax=Trichinella zimbabwensis TaxID=268475 RepID=A0A0V1GVZ2_9BILA|nr:hypothetical protein T11_9848 [Trichinella zimbabwensis]
MNSVPDSLEERFYEWYAKLSAPATYLVLVDGDMANSEKEESDGEHPKLTEAQLEAGMKSQKFKTSEESQKESAQDGTNSDEYTLAMEALHCKLKLCIVHSFLLGFVAALWLTSLSVCG